MYDPWAKWNFEKIDDTNFIFNGLRKKSKYKYIVPNKIKKQMDKITFVYQRSLLLFSMILVPINLLFAFPLLASILIWILGLKYLLRNCEKELIKKP